MATSPVQICNISIGWLGGTLITSLDDGTNEANLCKATYEPSRDQVLEERNWTFATKRTSLNPIADPP